MENLSFARGSFAPAVSAGHESQHFESNVAFLRRPQVCPDLRQVKAIYARLSYWIMRPAVAACP